MKRCHARPLLGTECMEAVTYITVGILGLQNVFLEDGRVELRDEVKDVHSDGDNSCILVHLQHTHTQT